MKSEAGMGGDWHKARKLAAELWQLSRGLHHCVIQILDMNTTRITRCDVSSDWCELTGRRGAMAASGVAYLECAKGSQGVPQ